VYSCYSPSNDFQFQVPVLQSLEEYSVLRQEKEEEKRKFRVCLYYCSCFICSLIFFLSTYIWWCTSSDELSRLLNNFQLSTWTWSMYLNFFFPSNLNETWLLSGKCHPVILPRIMWQIRFSIITYSSGIWQFWLQ
jgi:hypothetical protein